MTPLRQPQRLECIIHVLGHGRRAREKWLPVPNRENLDTAMPEGIKGSGPGESKGGEGVSSPVKAAADGLPTKGPASGSKLL